jgi:hypothetical protein
MDHGAHPRRVVEVGQLVAGITVGPDDHGNWPPRSCRAGLNDSRSSLSSGCDSSHEFAARARSAPSSGVATVPMPGSVCSSGCFVTVSEHPRRDQQRNPGRPRRVQALESEAIPQEGRALSPTSASRPCSRPLAPSGCRPTDSPALSTSLRTCWWLPSSAARPQRHRRRPRTATRSVRGFRRSRTSRRRGNRP